MARIAGIDIPANKRAFVGLTYIYGIGPALSRRILVKAGVDRMTKVKDLKDDEVRKIAQAIQDTATVEGELRKQTQMDIKRLIEIGSYRGYRHRRNLPVRGQRTHTNARTRKGPRRGIGIKRKATTTTKGAGTTGA